MNSTTPRFWRVQSLLLRDRFFQTNSLVILERFNLGASKGVLKFTFYQSWDNHKNNIPDTQWYGIFTYIYLHLLNTTMGSFFLLFLQKPLAPWDSPVRMAPLPRGTAKGRMPKIRLPQIHNLRFLSSNRDCRRDEWNGDVPLGT